MARKKQTEVQAPTQGEALPPSDVNGSAEPHNGKENGSNSERKPVFQVGPIATERNSSVSASVWANEYIDRRDGRAFTVYNVSVHAMWRDADGTWKPAKSVRGSHLYAMIYCLQRASDWILAQRDPSNDCPL
jgi:hypothetical protein